MNTLPNPSEANLTPRQRDVLRLWASGYSTKEIAGELGISQGTVEDHIFHRGIYAKLRTNRAALATQWAIKHGIVQISV